jgi:hypothetical protein
MMDMISLFDLEGWIASIVDVGASALGVIMVAAWLAWLSIPDAWTERFVNLLETLPCA